MGLWALLGVGSACVAGQGWGVETTYLIESIDEDAKLRLEGELKHPYDRYGLHVVDRGERGEPFQFRLTNLRSMRDLRAVQAVIQRVSKTARVPVVLQESVMRFASVYGQGRATISVAGSATPGASVVLDVGDEEVHGTVDVDGQWRVEISRSSKLSQRGGWIYALIRKGTARQYLRINVLDTAASERILPDDLPSGSPLLRR